MAKPGIPLIGQQPNSELETTQYVIPAGSGATFSASSNIGTVTFNAAHGLTMDPASGKMPNYFIGFGGTTSGLSGTGVLVGNIFRILTIPSTTEITIYTTITAATVTSLTGIPVFFPPFVAGTSTNVGGEPTMTVSSVTTKYALPEQGEASAYYVLGANCALRVNPAGTFTPLDATTGDTPATAPTWRDVIAASGSGYANGAYPYLALWANGTTDTSYVEVLE